MINWFGPESWGAPLCTTTPRCDVPVGVPCARCHQPIGPRDHGVTIPGFPGPTTWHLRCHLKSVLPHKAWEQAGLIPEACDGDINNGVFTCQSCGVSYSFAERRWWRVH